MSDETPTARAPMHPVPAGTRDVLPEEMAELRALERALLGAFESHGYGEVRTPAIEYDSVLARGDLRGAPAAHRFFDDAGELLALRSDMTVPIARLAATRLADREPPLRLSYVGTAYRAVMAQRGQMREFVQAGVELVGEGGPSGTAEVVEVLSAALDAAGLPRAVIGLGDASLFPRLLADVDVAAGDRDELLGLLASHDLVGLDASLERLGLPGERAGALSAIARLRGGVEVIDRAAETGGGFAANALEPVRETWREIERRGVAGRVRLDLGLLRDLGYYTGAILEVYDPALGHVLGGGGRYDELLGRFGRPLPAAGFALYLDRLHIAQIEQAGGER